MGPMSKDFWWKNNPFGGTSPYALTCEYPPRGYAPDYYIWLHNMPTETDIFKDFDINFVFSFLLTTRCFSKEIPLISY